MKALSTTDIYALTDLTLLDEQASVESLQRLAKLATEQDVAAVCVYPKHLLNIPASLNRATVINFPTGNEPQPQVLAQLTSIIQNHLAHEIDYVFPYTLYLSGQKKEALARAAAIYEYCVPHQKKLKIILETGAFPSTEHIYTLSTELLQQGCDFLKTSSGKINTGATPAAALAILSAIRDSEKKAGIKISGGIKTIELAQNYIHLAEKTLQQAVSAEWLRIGSSGFATK